MPKPATSIALSTPTRRAKGLTMDDLRLTYCHQSLVKSINRPSSIVNYFSHLSTADPFLMIVSRRSDPVEIIAQSTSLTSSRRVT